MWTGSCFDLDGCKNNNLNTKHLSFRDANRWWNWLATIPFFSFFLFCFMVFFGGGGGFFMTLFNSTPEAWQEMWWLSRGMTCSKRPQVRFKPWAAVTRTQPLYMGCTLSYQGAPKIWFSPLNVYIETNNSDTSENREYEPMFMLLYFFVKKL